MIASTLFDTASRSKNIDFVNNRVAVDLVIRADSNNVKRIVGVYAYNDDSGRVESFTAQQVVLATGGASKVYLYTSNPAGSTGDGIAMLDLS